MRGVTGQIKTGTFLDFSVTADKLQVHKVPLKRDGSYVVGEYAGWTDVHSRDFKLTYSDLIDKFNVVITTDSSYPKVRIFARLPAAERLEVPSFFIEGHFRFVKINVTSQNIVVDADKANKALLARAKMDLLKKVFFEYLADPIVEMQKKETPIGEMRVIVKKITGVEI